MGVCERVEVGFQKAPLKSSTLSLSLGLCLSFSLNPVSVSTSFQAQPQPLPQPAPQFHFSLSLSLSFCLTGPVGRRAISSPAYRHRGTMGLPQSSTRARHSARPGASGLPASTQAKSDAWRSPRRHTDTAERWVSPKARRGHGTVLGPAPAVSPPAHRPSGAAGLPAPLTPHTTSSRRLNAGSSRAASVGIDADPSSPRKAPRRPSPAGGLPASQEVRPPYFFPSAQKEHAPTQLYSCLTLRVNTARQ